MLFFLRLSSTNAVDYHENNARKQSHREADDFISAPNGSLENPIFVGLFFRKKIRVDFSADDRKRLLCSRLHEITIVRTERLVKLVFTRTSWVSMIGFRFTLRKSTENRVPVSRRGIRLPPLVSSSSSSTGLLGF